MMTISAYEAGTHIPWCPTCKGRMARLYGAPEVVRETYRAPRLVNSLKDLDGGNGDPPPFEGRAQENKYRNEHYARYGWGKE